MTVVTSVEYTGDGSQVLFTIPFPYISTDHVIVDVNGSVVTNYSFASATQIEFDTAPANGVPIIIYRSTEIEEMLVEYTPPGSIKAGDLNDANTQLLYLIQELLTGLDQVEVGALTQVINNLSSNSTTSALSANQGNVLNNLITTNTNNINLLLGPTIVIDMASGTNVDYTLGEYFIKTVDGNTTFTFTSPPNNGNVYAFTLEITHTSGTITFPSSVRWRDDTAPTLTTGRNHALFFWTRNGGTRWRGAYLPNYNLT